MRRYEELDSLRGLAALTVVFSHFMITFNMNSENTYNLGFVKNWYKYSPIHILWAGHEAVILFFLLSGFVLTLPFLTKKSFSYKEFLVKRIFRIYPASIISILLALCLMVILKNNTRVIDSHWINTYWTKNISFKEFISQLLLFGNYEVSISPVQWSLIHEMRISIVFPLIAYFAIRFKWIYSLVIALILSAIGYVLSVILHVPRLNLLVSLSYSSMFIVGSVLAKYRLTLVNIVGKLKQIYKTIIFVLGIVLYIFSWLFNDTYFIHNNVVNDWLIAMGGSIFIILSLSSKRISKILRTKVCKFLGKISYSLYLYHLILLIFFMKFKSGLSITNTLILTFILSVTISAISYKFIEKPFIEYGKRIVKRFRHIDVKETDLKLS